jgi:hypothetical protein
MTKSLVQLHALWDEAKSECTRTANALKDAKSEYDDSKKWLDECEQMMLGFMLENGIPNVIFDDVQFIPDWRASRQVDQDKARLLIAEKNLQDTFLKLHKFTQADLTRLKLDDEGLVTEESLPTLKVKGL